MMLMTTFHNDVENKFSNNEIIMKITVESKFLFDFEYDSVQNREFEIPVEDPNFFKQTTCTK